MNGVLIMLLYVYHKEEETRRRPYLIRMSLWGHLFLSSLRVISTLKLCPSYAIHLYNHKKSRRGEWRSLFTFLYIHVGFLFCHGPTHRYPRIYEGAHISLVRDPRCLGPSFKLNSPSFLPIYDHVWRVRTGREHPRGQWTNCWSRLC